MDPQFCPQCGAAIPPGARFCPRCGTTVAATGAIPDPAATPADSPVPPPRTVPVAAPRRKSNAVIWIAVAVVVLGAALFAVLTGMPFSRGSDETLQRTTETTQTIAEGAPVASTANGPIGESAPAPPVATAAPATAAPTPVPSNDDFGVDTTTVPNSSAQPSRNPRTQPAPSVTPAPPPIRRAPPPSPPMTSASPAEISEQDATARLASWLASNNPYDVEASCLDVHSLGYRNVGYTLDVVNHCVDGEHPVGSLGRWRVDSKTGEVFRQGADGRYLRP